MRLSRNVLNGTLFGVLFGALFPLVATLLTANNIPITNLSSLIDLHRQTPLLLIIDTAPFFLGVLAAFGAYQLDRRFQELIIENHTLNFKSLNQLIETANAPIIGIDNDDRITLWNEAIVQLSGYPKEEVMGVALTSLIDSGSVCVHQQTLQEGQSSTYEMVMLDKEGEQHQLLLSSSPQYNQRGEIVGCVSIGQDITELNAARQKEQIANELTVLIDTANAPIFGIDTAGLVNEWNQMAERITGYSKSEVMGQNLVESFITEDYKVSVKGVLDEALTGRETANYAFPLYSKTNARVDVLLNSTTRRNTRGEIVGCVSIGQDITELNAARQKEQIANELTVLIDTANAPIFGIDIEGLVNEWNQTAERITGYSKSEVMGRNLVESFITADYKASVKGVLDEALKGRETANYEFPLYSKTNARVDVLLNSTTRRDAQGRVSGVVGVGQDVTELNRSRKEFEKQLASAANYDVLTGLPNRRYFQDYLARQLEAHQGSDEVGTLLFLDLDRFKLVNDSLGHGVGDQLLKVVGQRLQASVRTGDLVCRLGGDEFVVLLPLKAMVFEQADERAEKIARQITAAVQQPIHVGQHELSAHISIGISHFHVTDSVETIITRSDNAMYLAKGDASSHIAFYTDAVHQQLTHQMQVLEGIQAALVENQFFMHYQPQFNHLQELIGVEALVRWQHPQLGLLTPDQFIGLAEQYHRINEVGSWILDRVLSQVAQWRQAGYVLPKVAINISPMQLLDENFMGVVDQLAEQYGINPEGIVFEITESADIEHFNLISTVLVDLKAQGYRFSLDDFGTGYASMTHFKRLPFSQVKIDQSFITDIVDNEDSLAIVEVVLAMAKSLKLEVIAEGVETAAQLDLLNKLGCTGYQGYLFSKPLSVQALTSLLRPGD